MLQGDNALIGKAEEAKLMTDYVEVDEDLETYKILKEGKTKYSDFVSDDKLVGEIYKKVFVNDTKRELGVIVDFNKLNSKPTYGKGGERLLKQENNNMETTKVIDTVYSLNDVYAVDFTDGNLYYINGNQIYSTSKKIQVENEETLISKYVVETLNQDYIEQRKFITKWDITLGDSEDSTTNNTIILPVNDRRQTYNATIYWGDGTSTLLQHNVNNIKLSDAQILEKVTHTYTLNEGDSNIVTISISGTYSSFVTINGQYVVTIGTKNKLKEIVQWGDVNANSFGFTDCANLEGSIPDLNIESGFSKCTGIAFWGCKKLSGEVPNIFRNSPQLKGLGHCFRNCSGIERLADDFVLPENLTSMNLMFSGCSKLESIGKKFAIPNTVTSLQEVFRNCSSLKELPDTFKVQNNIKYIHYLFDGCKSLKNIDVLDWDVSNVILMDQTFEGCTSLTRLDMSSWQTPNLTSLNKTFYNCSSLNYLDVSGINTSKVTSINQTFYGCKSLTSLDLSTWDVSKITVLGSFTAGGTFSRLPKFSKFKYI